MRNSIIWALVCLQLVSSCDVAKVWDHSGTDESRLLFFPDVLAQPIAVLSKSKDEVVATMKADRLYLSPVKIDEQDYLVARIAGFASSAARGGPEVPHINVTVNVPRNAAIHYEILEQRQNPSQTLEYDLAFEHRLPIHSGREVFASRDERAYRTTYGFSPVTIEDVSFSATDKVATIRFLPLFYDASQKTVQLTTYLKVRFYFSYADSSRSMVAAPVGGNEPGPLSRFHLNKSTAAARTSYTENRQPIDLVIAANEHKETLSRYLNFKRAGGRQVIEKYVSKVSNNEIKEMIAEAYRNTPPPTTTLLVGNIDQIPSFRGDGDNTWTDWNYTLLDQGNQPDVALGRVPAHNASELNIFIDKAMARETSPREIDKILLTSGKDRGMRCAENASEVGRAIGQNNDKINMTHHSMLHGASQSKVIEGYNSSPNFIVYDGHGYQQGMSEIPLLIADLEKLRNSSYPIILDIACLNANWSRGASARNFAESILFSKTGGAAGILASGGSGYGHNFFRDIGAIMAAARNTKGTKDNEIGHVILAAKSRASSQQDKSYWNYYGDPASSVWESNYNSTIPEPLAAPIFAMLGNDDADRPFLFTSATPQVDTMMYCLGGLSACSQSSSFLAMNRISDLSGRKIFISPSRLALATNMEITIWTPANNGGTRKVIRIVKN